MVEINNKTRERIRQHFLEEIAQGLLKEEDRGEGNLSVAFVSPEEMRRINKRYRNKDEATDVLSFGQDKNFLFFPKNEVELGEIVICPQKVKENAEKYNSSFEKEIARVFIHGILHLLGYNHEQGGEEARKMEEKQEYYLSKFRSKI